MASNSKKVSLEVAIKTQEDKLNALDKELENVKKKSTELSNTKIQMKIDANTTKLKDVNSQIKSVEAELKNLKGKADVDDSEVKALQSKLQSLKNQKINIQADIDQSKLQIERNNIQMKVDVEKSSLDKAKAEADSMDGQSITMTLDLAMQNFAQGIATCKQGVSELYDNIKQVEQAGAQTEQNMAFLTMNLGAEKARDTFKEISDIVASMPGDDNTMRSVLSTAQALGNNLNTQEMKDAAATMADYMSASATMGKMAKESQQDIMKYLLDGNTAELERGSIVSQYVDELKEASTFQERQAAMQKVLNKLGYGGISQQDTLLNKQAEWEGMIYNSESALSSMWLNAEKGAMDYILKLNESTDGLVGMGIVAGQMVLGPMTEIFTGIGQIGVGLKTLKEAADFTGIADKFRSLKDHASNAASSIKQAFTNAWKRIKEIDFGAIKQKLSDLASSALKTAKAIGTTLWNALKSAATAAKDAAIWIAQTGKELLISAANALKSAAAWVWDNAVKAASAIASKAAAAAQWLLNAAMAANPITLVVIAIVALVGILWYLYNTCEPVRNAIDGIWAGITSAIQPIVESVQWLIDKLTELANGDWTVTIQIIKAGVDTAVDTTMDLANNDISRGIVSMLLGPDALAQVDEAMPAFQEKLTTSINDMLTSIWDNGTWGFLNWLTNISGIDVGSYLSGMQSSFASIPEWVNQAGIGAIQGFQGMFAGISSWLNNIIINVVSFGGRLVNSITTAARNAWTSFVNNIKGMWKHMAEEVDAILREARRLLEQLPSMLWNAAVNMVRGWLTGSGEGSPGFMFYAFDEDLGAMESRAKDNNIASLIGGTARDMVKSWGNPNLSYSIEGTTELSTGKGLELSEILRLLGEMIAVMKDGNDQGNINNTFNLYGDMDDDKRMEKFLNAVRKELAWNNKTAGRTV